MKRESGLGPRRAVRRVSCMVALLGLGALSCGTDEELAPPQVDEVAPSRVEITGGVRPGASLSGQRTLEAVAEDNSGRVAKVSFFVSGVHACTDKTERDSGATFSCAWDTSTTREGEHQLVATAQDATGNTASSAPVAFSIGVDPPPTISGLVASPTSINEGQSTQLSVSASDPKGDALLYSWTQESPLGPLGTFTQEDTATPTWTAPLVSAATAFTLRATVSDENGGTAQRTVVVQVANVPAANRAPDVDAAITAPLTALAGETLSLSIGATDPDGDPLTFAWRTMPVGIGTFTDETKASAQWRSPDVAVDTHFTFQVTVSDGVASITRSVSVRITMPTYAAHIQPLWDQLCTGCHGGSSPSGNLDLRPANSYADLVGVNGTNKCGGVTSIKRVRASQPDSSLLVRKISGTTCGTRMPKGNSNYFVDNPGLVTRIRSWILAGAANN